MRKLTWILAVVAVAGSASLASAQSALSPLSGANARQTVNRPIDLSQAIAPAAPPRARKDSIFTRFFPQIALPGLPSRSFKPPVSPLPAPDKMPGAQYPSPFKPVAPTTQQLPTMKVR